MPSRSSDDAPLIAAVALIGLAFVAAVYLPDIGRGFVKDDFTWIRDARVLRAAPSQLLQSPTPGFYRPLVTATFAADEARYGLSARGYGFTNLALFLLCLAAIWALLREAGASAAAATVAVFAWAINPHGVNMALVWLSGRTSLLLTLCAALAAWAFLRRHRTLGALLLLAALLSKEEAVLLPAILAVWLMALRDQGERTRLRDAVALLVPLLLYLGLRSRTPAMTPITAPAFYRPTMDPQAVAANILQYADRAGTIFVVVGLLALLVYRTWPARIARPVMIASAAWIAGGFALTIWLPVRSSLYALFPSVGCALLLAALVDGLRAGRAHDLAPHRWLAAALASVLAFILVYRSRNDRWVEPARLSARVVRALQTNAPAAGASGIIVFEDEDREHASLRDAFGELASEAVLASLDRPFHAEVVNEARAWDGPIAARYRVTNGRVERVQ